MQIIRGDDYQSWVYSHGSDLIAVDPWLTKTQEFPILRWLLYRHSTEPAYLKKYHFVSKVNYLIITAHFSDHLDMDSLNQFDVNTPIYTTKAAERNLAANGFLNITIVKPGHKYQLGNFDLEIFHAGKPYHSTTFSYTLAAEGSIVFHEPHMLNTKLNFEYLDACILTVDQVKVLGLVQVSMSDRDAQHAKSQLNAKYLIATGIIPSRSKGLISWILSIVESTRSLPSLSLICKNSGDTFTC